MKILLVDDTPMQLDIIAAVLRANGNEVVTASSGEEAVSRVAASDDIGMILMDVKMPGMGGLEASRQIRAMGDRGKMPIVALSAGFLPDEQRASAQIDGFLAKDVVTTPSTISTAITDAVAANTRRLSENGQSNKIVSWMKLNLALSITVFTMIAGITGSLITGTMRYSDFAHQQSDTTRDVAGIRAQIDGPNGLHNDMKDVDRRLNEATVARVNDLQVILAALADLKSRASVLEARIQYVVERTATMSPLPPRRN